MRITFLGTSSAFPTEKRNHISILITFNGEGLLFDCGEGVQRQFRIARENIMKVNKIFITHWHGDHVFGLPGLLQSMSTSKRISPVDLFCPKGTGKTLTNVLSAFNIKLPFRINIHEVSSKKEKKICDAENYEIYSMDVKHSIPTIAYYFKEKDKKRLNKNVLSKYGVENNPKVKQLLEGKSIEAHGEIIKPKESVFVVEGKKVSIVLDTEYFEELVDFVKDSLILISEGTFSNKLREKAREKGGHMTVKDAARLAKKSNSKELYVCHFSQRYKDTKDLEKETNSLFKNTKFANDFDTITL